MRGWFVLLIAYIVGVFTGPWLKSLLGGMGGMRTA
jgi:hypothetical protein